MAGPTGIVLAGPGVAPCPIVIDTTTKPRERQPIGEAAADLVKYLSQITGQKFTLVAAADSPPARSIVIGLPAPGVVMGEEEFSIKTAGETLRITGGGGRGVLYGAYWFLERYAGCKWWTHDEEDVPKTETLRIPDIDINQKPAFAMHDLMNREAQNGNGSFLFKIRTTSSVSFTGSHSLNPLLTPYAKKNPEFWPMNKSGVRKANDLHFNYLAPGISDALTEALSGEVEKRNKDMDHFIYQAGMGDWYGGMDLSPDSQKMYEAETWTNPDGLKLPGYSAPLLKMINETAGQLDKKYPGIKVGTFAYMSLEAPPATVRPAENVYIWVPRLRHDTVLSVEESEENKPFRRNLEQWIKIAPGRVYIWDYGASFDNFMMPFPCLRSMARNIKYYHHIGVKGMMIQGNYVSTGGDLAALKNYVWRKLLWEPTLDIDALIRGFCKGYYGPAADEIIQYVNAMEDSVRKPVPIHADEFDTKRAYMTPELVAKLKALLAVAKAKTEADTASPYYRRVREVEASLEAYELWRKGPVAERDGRLIRTDINPAAGGEYTFDRAKEQIKYSRNASPREWGVAPIYQVGFLSMQGGPLHVIKNGPLEARIASRYSPSRLWRVSLDGKDAIDGGTITYAPDAPAFDPEGPPGEMKLGLRGEVGLADWSLILKQALGETYELTDDRTLRMTGTVQSLITPLPAGFDETQATVETRYTVADPAEFLCEVWSDDAWRKLEAGPAKPKVPLPAMTRLRITRTDRGFVVLDSYSGVPVTGGEVIYDATAKAFKTVVKLGPAEVPVARDAVNNTFVREVKVRPIP